MIFESFIISIVKFSFYISEKKEFFSWLCAEVGSEKKNGSSEENANDDDEVECNLDLINKVKDTGDINK